MLTDLLDWLQNLPPVWVVVGAGVLVFGECTLGLGFIAPGETGLFIRAGGDLAGLQRGGIDLSRGQWAPCSSPTAARRTRPSPHPC